MLLRLDDALVVTRPLAQDVPDEALSPSERGLADGAANERRQEIRAARAAAREAFAALGLHPLPSVLRDELGRPRVEPPGSVFVSIGHDGDLAVAAVASAPVGVDVIPLARAEAARRVVSRRIESGRARPLAEGSVRPFDEALLLWTAWEALGKRTGRGVLSGPMQEALRVERRDGTPTALTADTRLRWFEMDGHLLCLAGPLPA